jgi:hypothetical protein
MNALRALQLLAVALGVVAFTVPDSRADKIRFPPAPVDAASAAASLDERAKIVTRHNACGRIDQYAQIRLEQLQGNHEHQGEELTSILIGMIAWLTDPRFRDDNCLGLTRPFLRQQVNEAIRAMVKDGQMGTGPLPCFAHLKIPLPPPLPPLSEGNKGEWDVKVRDLVRILYMGSVPGHEVLDGSTIDYMYENLLAARGPLSDSSYSVVSDCDDPAGDELGSPEDWADRKSWYRELLEGIGDFFKWLAEFNFKVMAGSLLSAVSPAVLL